MSKKSNTSTKPVTLFVLHIDALSAEMLAHLANTWMVRILEQGTTAKHGLSFLRLMSSEEPPEGLLEYLDSQMNVLDYAIEGTSPC